MQPLPRIAIPALHSPSAVSVRPTEARNRLLKRADPHMAPGMFVLGEAVAVRPVTIN